jgi:hypothetical protein
LSWKSLSSSTSPYIIMQTLLQVISASPYLRFNSEAPAAAAAWCRAWRRGQAEALLLRLMRLLLEAQHALQGQACVIDSHAHALVTVSVRQKQRLAVVQRLQAPGIRCVISQLQFRASAAAGVHAHRHTRVEIERNPSEQGMRRRGGEGVEEVDVGERERVLGVADGKHDRAGAAVALARDTGCKA